MRRQFATLDVFTDRRFAGNPLAVVLEAEGLAAAAMQAIAREFGHPETVFVLTPGDRSHRARLRIFTPARELPFAGHPTVGTAVLLGLRDGKAVDSAMVLQEDIGPVRCTVEPGSGGRSARFVIPQLPARCRRSAERCSDRGRAAARADRDRLRATPPARWSAGFPATLVPVASLTAVARCRPDLSRFGAAFGDGPAYVFCGECVDPGHDFHAWMFAPTLGVAEDPATGSAAAALAGLYAAGGDLAEGPHAVVIEQGYEMGRPSEIRLAMEVGSQARVGHDWRRRRRRDRGHDRGMTRMCGDARR